MEKYFEISDVAFEGRIRSNLDIRLRKLRRFDEALQEIHWAIECKAQFSHASHPYTSWDILADIERDADKTVAPSAAKHKTIS